MAVTVKFIADVVNWLSGLDKTEAAVGDNEQALEDLMKQAIELGRAAGKTTDQIASDFSKAFGVPLDRAQKAIDEVTSATGDLEDGATQAGSAVGDEISKGASTAGDKMSELGSIAKDVLAGDFSGAAESAAGALSLLGPAGAAAGAAAAIGIGFITSAIQDAEDHRKELEQRAGDLAQAYIDAGSSVLDSMTVAARSADILTNPETKKQAQELAKALGVDLPTATRALAGDTNALAVANNLAAGTEEERLRLMQESAGYMNGTYSKAEKDRLDQLQKQHQAVDDLNKVNGDATESFKAQQGVLVDLINNAQGATKEVDELGNELYSLPDGTKIMVDADTHQATTDVSRFKGDLDGVPESVTSTVKVRVDDTAWRNWTPFQKLGIVKAVPQSGSGVPWKTQDLG